MFNSPRCTVTSDNDRCDRSAIWEDEGLCREHQRYAREGRELKILRTRKTSLSEYCIADKCPRKAVGHDLCHAHLKRKNRGERYLDVEIPQRSRSKSGEAKRPAVNSGRKKTLEKCEVCGNLVSSRKCPSCRAKFYSVIVGPYGITRKRKESLWVNFRLTVNEYVELLEFQNLRCAGCGTDDPPGRGWHVDHDHSCCPSKKSCGKCVRGILCALCNTALGHLRDNPSTLRNLASYLEAGRRN